jgi:hypothetical protein
MKVSSTMKKTKKQLIQEIYSKNHHLSRTEIVTIVVNRLGITASSARTQVSHAAKETNASLGKTFVNRTVKKDGLKREQARKVILENYQNCNRKDIIQLILTETSIKSESSASSHVSMIMKEEGISF